VELAVAYRRDERSAVLPAFLELVRVVASGRAADHAAVGAGSSR
jgi:hypothetical protein